MSKEKIIEAVRALSEKERLELARRIIQSIESESSETEQVAEAVRGIEDVVTGKVAGLSETEFRNALR
ncbi:MAG TPA: addiction module protein [Candidatus Angelobacter sp.]|nr:addiction module protein [Candidatus Angelobacter sp.]